MFVVILVRYSDSGTWHYAVGMTWHDTNSVTWYYYRHCYFPLLLKMYLSDIYSYNDTNEYTVIRSFMRLHVCNHRQCYEVCWIEDLISLSCFIKKRLKKYIKQETAVLQLITSTYLSVSTLWSRTFNTNFNTYMLKIPLNYWFG